MCLPQKHKWLIKGAHTNFTIFFDFIKKKKYSTNTLQKHAHTQITDMLLN